MAGSVDNRGERHLLIVPTEKHVVGVARQILAELGSERHSPAAYFKFFRYRALLPALQVADQTAPAALAARLKHQHVVLRLNRFEQKDLYARPGSLAELHTGIDHPRVVAHHERSFWKISRKIGKMTMLDFPVGKTHQQLAAVAHSQRMPRDALIGERIIKICYLYLFYCIMIHNRMIQPVI